MVEEVTIDSDERRRLTTRDIYEVPKYTFFALDAAVQYSGANQKHSIGDVEAIYQEFEEEYPDGTFEDWKQFYLQNYQGESRLEDATEDAHRMFLRLRESIEQIDQSDIRNYIEELVLNKTYGQQNPREAIAEKLVQDKSPDFGFPTKDPESGMIHLTYQGRPVTIQSKMFDEDDVDIETDDDLLVLFYEEQANGQITVDLSNLNTNLDDF
jgi:hypothetical protein